MSYAKPFYTRPLLTYYADFARLAYAVKLMILICEL